MKKLILTALFFILTVTFSFAGNPSVYPLFQAIDSDGDPVSGGLVYTYGPGTTTLKTAYTDEDFTVAASNPIVLDSKGQAEFYLKGVYKINVTTSAGVQVDGFPVDNIRGPEEGSAQDNYYPDYSAADQGVTGDSNTLKYYIDLIDSDQATIVLRHNSGSATTTYTLTTSETIPANITLVIERGARFSGAGKLTMVNDPEAGPYQIATSTFDFDGLQVVYSEWFGAVTGSVSGAVRIANSAAINSALSSLSSNGGIVQFLAGDYEIKGINSETTFFKQYANDHCIYALDTTVSNGIKINNIALTDSLGIATRTVGHGIFLDGSNTDIRFDIEAVEISGFVDGIHVDGGIYSKIGKRTRLRSPQRDCLSLQDTVGGSQNIGVEGVGSIAAGRYGFNIDSGVWIKIYKSFADSSTDDGFHITNTANLELNTISSENSGGDAYDFDTVSSFTMISCSGTGTGTVNGLKMVDCIKGTLISLVTQNTSGWGILSTNATAITLINPSISSFTLGYISDDKGEINETGGGFSPDGDTNTTEGLLRIRFQFSDLATAGTWNSGVWLPAKALVKKVWIWVDDTFVDDNTDATTIAIQTAAAGDIVAPIAISDGTNPWDAGGHNGIPDGDATTFIDIATKQQLSVVLAGGDTLTGGSMTIGIKWATRF
jgi:hypothetical protein